MEGCVLIKENLSEMSQCLNCNVGHRGRIIEKKNLAPPLAKKRGNFHFGLRSEIWRESLSNCQQIYKKTFKGNFRFFAVLCSIT